MGRRVPKPRGTEERLKSAASTVFTTRGYGVSGVDHIVEQAGTTRGAFYYYFASKADVARDVQVEMWSGAARQSEAVLDHETDFLTNVRRGLEAYLNALQNLGPERAFLREGFADPTLAMVDGNGEKWARLSSESDWSMPWTRVRYPTRTSKTQPRCWSRPSRRSRLLPSMEKM